MSSQTYFEGVEGRLVPVKFVRFFHDIDTGTNTAHPRVELEVLKRRHGYAPGARIVTNPHWFVNVVATSPGGRLLVKPAPIPQ